MTVGAKIRADGKTWPLSDERVGCQRRALSLTSCRGMFDSDLLCLFNVFTNMFKTEPELVGTVRASPYRLLIPFSPCLFSARGA